MLNIKSQLDALFIHPSAIVDEGAQIGPGSKIWHFSHICSGAKIGEGVVIGQNVFIANRVVIGNGVKIQNNVSVYDDITIEDDVFCGPSMVFTNVINPRSHISRKNEYQTTIVRKGTTIGANATIVCGNELGAYSFVGAGAVITRSIPAHALVVGNPARQTGWMGEYGVRLEEKKDSNKWICPATQQMYQLINGKMTRLDS